MTMHEPYEIDCDDALQYYLKCMRLADSLGEILEAFRTKIPAIDLKYQFHEASESFKRYNHALIQLDAAGRDANSVCIRMQRTSSLCSSLRTEIKATSSPGDATTFEGLKIAHFDDMNNKFDPEFARSFARWLLGQDTTLPIEDVGDITVEEPSLLEKPTTAGVKRSAPVTDQSSSRKRQRHSPETVSWEEFAQEPVKRRIFQYPHSKDDFFYAECKQHEMLFNSKKNPAQGAAKHLRGPGHNLRCGHAEAVEKLGVRIVGCTKAFADEYNASLDRTLCQNQAEARRVTVNTPPVQGLAASRERRTQKATASSSALGLDLGDLMGDINPRNPRHIPAPQRQRPALEVDPATVRPRDIMCARWGKSKALHPLIILPFDPWHRIGWDEDPIREIGLLRRKDKLPRCYDENGEWAPGYRDGESLAWKRLYAVAWFNNKRFPTKLQTNWVQASRLRRYDPNNELTKCVDRVEDFLQRPFQNSPTPEWIRLGLSPPSVGDPREDSSQDHDAEDDDMEEDGDEEESEENSGYELYDHDHNVPSSRYDDDPGAALLTDLDLSPQPIARSDDELSITDTDELSRDEDDDTDHFSNRHPSPATLRYYSEWRKDYQTPSEFSNASRIGSRSGSKPFVETGHGDDESYPASCSCCKSDDEGNEDHQPSRRHDTSADAQDTDGAGPYRDHEARDDDETKTGYDSGPDDPDPLSDEDTYTDDGAGPYHSGDTTSPQRSQSRSMSMRPPCPPRSRLYKGSLNNNEGMDENNMVWNVKNPRHSIDRESQRSREESTFSERTRVCGMGTLTVIGVGG
ncbi:hypothetical protein F66182_5780 [Fusarium sp. NRRL 66182]|nr:hypothetical protein F66182_5780 [Fusarium sp. NRRL 66182]